MTETFAERRARTRAAFEAEWQANHGPRTLTNDDPINPHKHVADTEPGTRCMVQWGGLCMIPHDCRCPILWACQGGCYQTEVSSSYHPNRPTVAPEPEPTPAPSSDEHEIAIDRTKWDMVHVADDTWNVRVDGHDAAMAIENPRSEDGFSVYLSGETVWPENAETWEKYFPTQELTIQGVRAAWEEYWAYCDSCGEPTAEADRAVLVVGSDTIGVHCPACRQA